MNDMSYELYNNGMPTEHCWQVVARAVGGTVQEADPDDPMSRKRIMLPRISPWAALVWDDAFTKLDWRRWQLVGGLTNGPSYYLMNQAMAIANGSCETCLEMKVFSRFVDGNIMHTDKAEAFERAAQLGFDDYIRWLDKEHVWRRSYDYVPLDRRAPVAPTDEEVSQ